MPPLLINGWAIYTHPLFLDQFETLLQEVEALQAKDSTGYRKKKKAKLLAAVFKVAFEVIPEDPSRDIFQLGNTLGPSYRHWRRFKFFGGRYRLFFRYSLAQKIIILAWVNDDESLRTYGSKSDAYAVFQKMLSKDRPPDSWEALLKEAQKAIKQTEPPLSRASRTL